MHKHLYENTPINEKIIKIKMEKTG